MPFHLPFISIVQYLSRRGSPRTYMFIEAIGCFGLEKKSARILLVATRCLEAKFSCVAATHPLASGACQCIAMCTKKFGDDIYMVLLISMNAFQICNKN